MSVNGTRLAVGARRFGYAESFYFGNPGNYQSYLLAYNDAGVGEFSLPRLLPSIATGDLLDKDQQAAHSGPTEMDAKDAIDFSRDLVINTVAVIDQFDSPDSVIGFVSVGVDADTVRKVPE